MSERQGVKLGFAGDVWLRAADPRFQSGAYLELFDGVRSWIADCDIACANLECFIDDSVPKDKQDWKSKPKHLYTHPNLLVSLREAGFNFLNLANNHVLDGGTPGLRRTQDALRAAGIPSIGAGRDRAEAERVYECEVHGLRFAFLSAAEWPEDFVKPGRPGVAPMPLRSSQALVERVQRAADGADVVVVQLHGDLEFSAAPAPYRVRLARRLVEAGAKLVVQHHPHVLQGVDEYQDGLIAYSLGNFVFPLASNGYLKSQEGVRDGGWLEVELDAAGAISEWRMRPVYIDDSDCPAPADTARSERILRKLDEQQRVLADSAALRRLWWRRCRAEFWYHALMVYYRVRRKRIREAMAYAMGLPFASRNRRWLTGAVTGGFL